MSDLPPPQFNPPPAASLPSSGGGGYALAPRRVPERLEAAYYGTGLVILLSIVTFSIWTYLWTWRTSEDLKRYNGDGLGPGIALVLRFVFVPVLFFTIPNEIEKMYQRDGQQSPISTWWGLWVLLPLVGPFVWYVKVQRTLNDFWRSKGAAAG